MAESPTDREGSAMNEIERAKFTITTEAIEEHVSPLLDDFQQREQKRVASWHRDLSQMMVEVYARGVADGFRQGIAHMGGVGGVPSDG